MQRSTRRLLAALITVLAFAGLAPAAHADSAFTSPFSRNVNGDIAIVGNTLMSCDTLVANCDKARSLMSGAPSFNNNDWDTRHVDVDADTGTFNSSRAVLSLPSGATVLHAQLVWGANTTGGTNGTGAPTPADRNKVKLTVGGSTTTLTADRVDLDATNASATPADGRYGAVADVTALVRAAGSREYTVADVQAGTGRDRYAGWALVVAYQDPDAPARNLSIFNGYEPISGSSTADIFVNGFHTPRAAPVASMLGLVSYEGDYGLTGDQAKLESTSLSNGLNPATNVFNSTISRNGVAFTDRTPTYANLMGFDADVFSLTDAVAPMTTSATIHLTTTSERYIPNTVTLATALISPRIVPTHVPVDLNGGQIEPGDVLEYTIAGTNTGDDDATDVVVSDDLAAGLDYVAGSLRLNGGALTDSSGNDAGEFAGGTATVRVGAVPQNASFTVKFRATVAPAPAAGRTVTEVAEMSYKATTVTMDLTSRSAPDTVTVRAPDLALGVVRSGALVRGTHPTYRFTATNVGQAGTDGPAHVVADFPAGVEPTGATGTGWSCAITGQHVDCARTGILATGASFPDVVVTTQVTAAASGTLQTVGEIQYAGDAFPVNDTATDSGPGSASTDLRISSSVAPGAATVGEAVTYTLVARNDGPSGASGVEVRDVLPAGMTLRSIAATQGTCGPGAVCHLGSLASGASATVTLVAVPARSLAGATASDAATVTGAEPDPDATNNSASTALTVRPAAELALAPQGEPVVSGTALSYALSASNQGPSPATQVVIRDELPEGATYTGATAEGGSCTIAGRFVTCEIASLAVGESRTVALQVALDGSLAGRSFRTTPRVGAAESDEVLADNETVVAVDRLPVAAPARCSSVRRFLIKLRQRRGERFRTVSISIAGKPVKVLHGRRKRAVIDLRGLTAETVKVRIKMVTTKGKVRTGTRTYHPCAPVRLVTRGPRL